MRIANSITKYTIWISFCINYLSHPHLLVRINDSRNGEFSCNATAILTFWMICWLSIIHWRDSWIILNNWANIFRNCAICKQGERKSQINYTLRLFLAALEMDSITLWHSLPNLFFSPDKPKISPPVLLTRQWWNQWRRTELPSLAGWCYFPLREINNFINE